MSESLARALGGHTGLGESPSHDAAPVDRLHAVAAAQRKETYADCRDASAASFLASLGRDLYSLINADGERWRWRCEIGLANALRWDQYRLSLTPETAMFVAIQTIKEVKNDRCRVCNGRTDEYGIFSIPDSDRMAGREQADGPIPMRPCPQCGGTGKHRFSDEERAATVGEAARFTRAFDMAHALISQSIREVLRGSRQYMK